MFSFYIILIHLIYIMKIEATVVHGLLFHNSIFLITFRNIHIIRNYITYILLKLLEISKIVARFGKSLLFGDSCIAQIKPFDKIENTLLNILSH